MMQGAGAGGTRMQGPGPGGSMLQGAGAGGSMLQGAGAGGSMLQGAGVGGFQDAPGASGRSVPPPGQPAGGPSIQGLQGAVMSGMVGENLAKAEDADPWAVG